MIQSVKIPKDRIGVLIGKGGETKEAIEKQTGMKLIIDSDEGDVDIDYTHAPDPAMALAVQDVVVAIGRGFSAERAIKLLDTEIYLEVLDIRDYVGKKVNHVARMRARVIGTKGKTRMLFEELTGVYLSVQGSTVAVIGDLLQIEVAKRGLEMLLSGSEHAAVYKFLEGRRAEIKIDGMGF
jgi:ribosomal RNA assembly protein